MIPLSLELINDRWKLIENMSLEEVPDLITDLGQNQPYILTYLVATGSDILNEKEREMLLFLGIMVWNISKHQISEQIEISSEELIYFERKNILMLEYLSGEPENDFFCTVERIMSRYHQHSFLKYIIDILMEDSRDESCGIRQENIGMIVIYIKSLIDCFDTY
ncbi:MAG: hypothetical protein JW915_25215 [Chitinispirillaceae bacterium]|nr:hypothetical protein [Chitinispirillaceae bacterium]